MADIFQKFEEFWSILWNYIYSFLAHFDINIGKVPSDERVDEDFTIPHLERN